MYDSEIIITDGYQDEVYLEGYKILQEQSFRSVIDLGTGRAFKLMKYFRDVNTLGLDLPPTVDWLTSQEGYPDRDWSYIPLIDQGPLEYELLICADVIEHVVDPDLLCDFIRRCEPKFAVISTPDRDLLKYRGRDNGPPYNECHVREWSFEEFGLYMEDNFPGKIVKHWYPNKAQVCQGVVVKF